MTAKQIARFHELTGEIDLARQSKDEQRLSELDEAIAEVWEQILNAQPADLDETQSLVSFLMNRPRGYVDTPENSKRATEKIIDLFSYKHPE